MNARSDKPVIADTGFGSGHSRAIVLYFAERGYNTAIWTRTWRRLRKWSGVQSFGHRLCGYLL